MEGMYVALMFDFMRSTYTTPTPGLLGQHDQPSAVICRRSLTISSSFSSTDFESVKSVGFADAFDLDSPESHRALLERGNEVLLWGFDGEEDVDEAGRFSCSCFRF